MVLVVVIKPKFGTWPLTVFMRKSARRQGNGQPDLIWTHDEAYFFDGLSSEDLTCLRYSQSGRRRREA
jgi:hypothetical protein